MYGKTEAGVGLPVLVDSSGALIVSETGKYREATKAGRVFVVSNQAPVNVIAGMHATYTGLAVCNPAGSGKNIAMLGFGYAQTIAVPTTACAIGLMTGTGTGDAAKAIVARNRLSGGVASVANCDDDCAFDATPVLEQVFSFFNTGAVTNPAGAPVNWVDLDGSLILTPGYYAAAYCQAVNDATFIFSFMWEEYTP